MEFNKSNTHQLKSLFVRFMNDGCTTEEITLLMSSFNNLKNEEELKQIIAEELVKDSKEVDANEKDLDSRLQRIYKVLQEGIRTDQSNVGIWWLHTYFKYAAVIFLFSLSAGLYFYTVDRAENRLKAAMLHDVAPGGNKAVLTLADGSEISLSDESNGLLGSQGGINILKTNDGQLIYQMQPKQNSVSSKEVMVFNTLSTPRGGKYQLNLPDGTKVWLNSASSIKFPATFANSNKREVILSGEAYFEVAKNKEKPFLVITSASKNSFEQKIEVLGTHFNINAYAGEGNIKTSLLEGCVKVIVIDPLGQTRDVMKLRPGQQTILNDEKLELKEVDMDAVIAWKNGLFHFRSSDFRSVMRQFSRWYDIEIAYEGKEPDIKLSGEIHREVNLSQALEILSYFKIKYRIEEIDHHKKIIISP